MDAKAALLTSVCQKYVKETKPSVTEYVLSLATTFMEQILANPDNAENIFAECAKQLGDIEFLEYLYAIITITDENIDTNSPFAEKKAFGSRKWTLYEDMRLIKAVITYDNGDWARISKFVGFDKSRKECEYRWKQVLNPSISRDVWSDEEDIKLFNLVLIHGTNSWSRIASEMQSRTRHQCRARFFIIKDSLQQQIDYSPQPPSEPEEIPIPLQQETPQVTFSQSLNGGVQFGVFFEVHSMSEIKEINDFLIAYKNLHQKVSLTCITTNENITRIKNREVYDEIIPYTFHGDTMEAARLGKAISETNDIRHAERRIENLCKYTREIVDTVADEIKNWYVDFAPNTHGRSIDVISDILNNVIRGCAANGFRHNETIIDLAFLIHSKSPSAYTVLRKFIEQFPCERTIWNNFNHEIQNMIDMVQDASRVKELLEYINYNLPKDGQFAVAIDAICLTLWEPQQSKVKDGKIIEMNTTKQENADDEKQKHQDPRYLFIFLGMPLNFPEKNVILHVIAHESGNSSKIKTQIDDAIKTMKKNGIAVKYAITDGDTGYSLFHQPFFDLIARAKSRKECIRLIRDYIKTHTGWGLDIIHLAKLQRFRFVCDEIIIIVHPRKLSTAVDPELFKRLCKLGDAIDNTSDIGKLKDKYPITIFSVYCMLVMFREQHYNEILFLAPLALWLESIRNEALNKKTRLVMMKIALEILLVFNAEATGSKRRSLGTLQKNGVACQVYFYGTLEIIKQMIITISMFIIELKENDRLNFSHLTTMTEEHLNGLLRVMAHFKHGLATTLTSVAEVNITLALHHKYDIQWNAAGRDEQGGITFDPNEHTVDIDLGITPQQAAQALLSVCGYQFKQNTDHLNALGEFLSKIHAHHSCIFIGTDLSNPLSGVAIFSRLKSLDEKKQQLHPAVGLNIDIHCDPVKDDLQHDILGTFPEGEIIPNKYFNKSFIKRIQNVIMSFVTNNSGTSKENIIYRVRSSALRASDKDLKDSYISSLLNDLINKGDIKVKNKCYYAKEQENSEN